MRSAAQGINLQKLCMQLCTHQKSGLHLAQPYMLSKSVVSQLDTCTVPNRANATGDTCGGAQVMLNVQRTLAIELQKLSVQFRKQQKAYLTRLRKAEGGGPSGLSVLDGTGERPADEEYDPGFSEIQVSHRAAGIRMREPCASYHAK